MKVTQDIKVNWSTITRSATIIQSWHLSLTIFHILYSVKKNPHSNRRGLGHTHITHMHTVQVYVFYNILHTQPKWQSRYNWWAKQPSQVACISEHLSVEELETTCGHKAKDITLLIAWSREAQKEEALDDLPWEDEKGPSSIRPTAALGKLPRDGVECIYGLSRMHRYHHELNWTRALMDYISGTILTAIIRKEPRTAAQSSEDGLIFEQPKEVQFGIRKLHMYLWLRTQSSVTQVYSVMNENLLQCEFLECKHT